MNQEEYRAAMHALPFSADFAPRTAALLRGHVEAGNKEEQTMRKPKKLALLLAAAVAVLAVSVSAACPERLQEIVWELKTTFFASGETPDGSFAAIRVPEVTLEEQSGRVILSVEGDETDITDALAQSGCYAVEQAEEAGRLQIEVTGTPEACLCTIRGYRAGEDAPLFTVTREKGGEGGQVAYQTPDGETVSAEESVVIDGRGHSGTETVTVTKNDAFTIAPDAEGGVFGLDTDDPQP